MCVCVCVYVCDPKNGIIITEALSLNSTASIISPLANNEISYNKLIASLITDYYDKPQNTWSSPSDTRNTLMVSLIHNYSFIARSRPHRRPNLAVICRVIQTARQGALFVPSSHAGYDEFTGTTLERHGGRYIARETATSRGPTNHSGRARAE